MYYSKIGIFKMQGMGENYTIGYFLLMSFRYIKCCCSDSKEQTKMIASFPVSIAKLNTDG